MQVSALSETDCQVIREEVTLAALETTSNLGIYAMGIISSVHIYFLSLFNEKENASSYLASYILGTINSSFMLIGGYASTTEKTCDIALSFLGGLQNLIFATSWITCNKHHKENLLYYSWIAGAINSVLAIPYAGYNLLF